jgi:PAS domain S-box-containing protein
MSEPQAVLRRAKLLLACEVALVALVAVVASALALRPPLAMIGLIVVTVAVSWRWLNVPAMRLMADSMDALEAERRAVQAEIAARRELEEKLTKQAERYDVAMKAASMGVWDWDVQRDVLEFDNHQHSLFGVDTSLGVIDGDWRKRVHPEDLPTVEASIAAALRGEGTYSKDFRITRDDGGRRWLHGTGIVVRDASGRPLRLVGVNIDVTARHLAEEQRREIDVRLREAAASLEEAQALARVGSWSFDVRTGVTDWSRQMYALFGRDPALGPPDYESTLDQYLPSDAAWLDASFAHAIETGTPYRGLLQLKRPKGGVAIVHAEAKVTLDAAGKPLRLLGTVVDMTASVAREEALKRAQILAEAASRAKSEFLANMSHEIRTPMAAVLGYIDLLADPNLPRAQFRDYAATIQRNAGHLLGLINQVLDLSKIEAGHMAVEPAACSPEALLRETTSLLRPRAVEKMLSFTLRFDGPIPATIETDATRLRQILLNLIGNAIKFTERGGVEIVVALDRTRSTPQLVVSVEDTGIGIEEAQLACLFRPFSQADSSITRRFGGTGLGLSIVSHLTRLLGGGIEVRSTPSVGTCFTARIATGELEGVALIECSNEAAVEGAQMDSKAQTPSAAPLSGLRVLLVEDGPDNQRLISLQLARAGAEVEVLANGQLAIERLMSPAAHSFDAVLMDMQMPVMDGYTATSKLRRMGFAGTIVALTAHAMEGDRQKCLQAGCDDYATKPIDSKRLVALVLVHLRPRVAPAPASDPAQLEPTIVSSYQDDPDMAELIEQFARSLPERIGELEAAFAMCDWDKLKRLAHQLKGAGGGYGFSPISDAAQHVEEARFEADGMTALRGRLDALVSTLRAVRAPSRRAASGASNPPSKGATASWPARS